MTELYGYEPGVSVSDAGVLIQTTEVPDQEEPMAADDLTLKETAVRKVKTNTTVKIDIDGKSRFYPKFSGWGTLALYANLDLPPGGSEARKAIARGGVRTWFQEVGAEVDETGLDGPWPTPVFGSQHQLLRGVWPHAVSTSTPWEFCFRVYAYTSTGALASYEMELETREIKIINDKS